MAEYVHHREAIQLADGWRLHAGRRRVDKYATPADPPEWIDTWLVQMQINPGCAVPVYQPQPVSLPEWGPDHICMVHFDDVTDAMRAIAHFKRTAA